MNSAYTEAPVITFSGSLINSISAAQLRAASVSMGLGATPGVAVISVPALRPYQMPDTAGDDVYINMNGVMVFHGWVFDVRYGEDPGNSQIDLYCYDVRIFLERLFIGDPRHVDFPIVGTDYVFNKDGRPDKHPDTATWARGSKAAVFWAIKDIIEYLDTFTDMVGAKMPYTDFDDASGASDYPGEVTLSGLPVSQAIDNVLAFLGNETWDIDYLDDDIRRVSMQDMPVTKVIKYYTDAGVADADTASSWQVTFTKNRARNRIYAISGPRLTEATYDEADDGLIRDDSYLSPTFRLRYSINPERYNTVDKLGPAVPADSIGKPLASTLITRKQDIGTDYISPAEYIAAPNAGVPLNDRDTLWIQKKVDEDDQADQKYWRVTGGYEIEQEQPSILLEAQVKALDDQNAEQILQVPGEVNDVRLTLVSDTGFQTWAVAYQSSPYPYDFTALLHHPEHQIMARHEALAPDLSDVADPTATVEHNTDYRNVVDVDEALDPIAQKALKAGKRVYREMVATLEIPQAIFLGWEIQFLPTDYPDRGSMIDPGTDPMICVGVDMFFEDAQRVTVRAVNQLGADYMKARPAAESAITSWRYREQASRAVLAMQGRIQMQVDALKSEAEKAKQGSPDE